MNKSILTFLSASSLLVLLAISSAKAQSTDPDNPTVLTNGTIDINFPSEITKYYFSFTATGGEIKLTADVSGGAHAYCEIVDLDFKSLIGNFLSSPGGNPSRRTIHKKSINKSQKVIMIVHKNTGAKTSAKLKLEGAVKFGAGQQSNPNASDTPNASGSGKEAAFPTENKANFTLKNGKTAESAFRTSAITYDGIKKKLSITLEGIDLKNFSASQIKTLTIKRN